ncbi:MAG TPA: bifunctional nuclease domain-containing protein [Myxococcales bacterium]|nr:bifunctional nuclease domain-containing protein [Myxococcales bacterium]
MGEPRTSFVALVLAACAAGALCGALRLVAPGAPAELAVLELVHVRGGQMVLVLEEKHGERLLPVPVSRGEAEQIDSARGGRGKLLPAALAALGGRVLSASLDEASGSGVSAHLTLGSGSQKVRVDARAGEAIALALATGAPIVVDPSLLEAAGVHPDELRGKTTRTLRRAEAEAPVLGI